MININDFKPKYIRSYSDLFLGPDNIFFPPREETDAFSLLVLAGNIFKPFSLFDDKSFEVKEFLDRCTEQFPYTLIIPGYLEDLEIQNNPDLLLALQDVLSERYSNVFLMSNDSIQFGDLLRLSCSPLYTDFSAFSEFGNDLEMNFELPINIKSVISTNSNSKDFIYKSALRLGLESNPPLISGVVTHTAPSSRFASLSNIDDQIENVTSYTSLDYIIKAGLFDFYLWGNTFQTIEQRSKIRNKNVFFSCNSRGIGKHINADFDILSLIEIAALKN
jgi:hypothetical protein